MRQSSSLIRWAAIGVLIMTVFLTTVELVSYAQVRATFPTGLKIAGVPVGGLSYTAASERLVQVYLSPIEIKYGDARIQVRPATLGFELRLDNMLAAADKQRVAESFWSGFWKYLWNEPISSQDIPLQATYDDERIKSFLENEIAVRYNEPSTPPMPIPGESGFYPGQTGSDINYEASIQRIKQVLGSNTTRTVNLDIKETSPVKPTIDLLEIMLKDIIDASTFDGLIELYLKDLETGMILHFTHSRVGDEEVPVNIAYSSWSTIKIPVLISAFRRLSEPYDPDTLALIEKMVEHSDNDSTDELASEVISKTLAPLEVTEDLRTLGLNNTFWGGFFYVGAPLLQDFKTPANQRTDYDTGPDRYAQTTPQDLGLLLEDIYYCAEDGGGSLPIAFPGEITQAECQLMVQYLGLNKIGVLIQAGVPSGATVAHKHGWAYEIDDGYIHTIGDAGVVYTAGGNYILSVFAYHPVQAVFDPVNLLVANLSSAAYNYFNLGSQ
ncbi:MAG: serine hydrolase [Anaerolineaceae bacterium]